MSKFKYIIILAIFTVFLCACNENWGKEDFVNPSNSQLQDHEQLERLVYSHNQLSFRYKVMENAYGFIFFFLIEVGIVVLYFYHINVQDKKREIQMKELAVEDYVTQMQAAQSLIAIKQHEISGLTSQLLHGDKTKLVDQLILKTEILRQLKINPRKLSHDNLLEIEREVNHTFDGYEKRLATFVPTLTDSELALCSLIKIGLSVKDIATVICIESTSVSRRKQRIKDKVAMVAGTFDAKRTIDQWLREF